MIKREKIINRVRAYIHDKKQMISLLFVNEDEELEMTFKELYSLLKIKGLFLIVEGLKGAIFNEFESTPGDLHYNIIKNNPTPLVRYSISFPPDLNNGIRNDHFVKHLNNDELFYRKFDVISSTKSIKRNSPAKSFIQIITNTGVFSLSEIIFKKITGLEVCEHDLIIGSYLTVETWNEGDVFIGLNGKKIVVKKSGVILKNPEIRTAPDFISAKNSFLRLTSSQQRKSINVSGPNDPLHYWSNSNGYYQYGGPPDGYGGFVSDDFINDALGGEPDAIWNID